VGRTVVGMFVDSGSVPSGAPESRWSDSRIRVSYLRSLGAPIRGARGRSSQGCSIKAVMERQHPGHSSSARHWHGTSLLSALVGVRVVEQLMCHKSLDTTALSWTWTPLERQPATPATHRGIALSVSARSHACIELHRGAYGLKWVHMGAYSIKSS
jgi:hypothetical protein